MNTTNDKDRYDGRGLRSLSADNPKEAGQQFVAHHTAQAGPEGPPLRRKYRIHGTAKKGGKR